MKKALSILALLLGLSGSAWASFDYYDFSFTFTFEGNTLYYTIMSNSSSVFVTYPGSEYNPYYGYTAPTGALTIPDSVTYNGITYSVTSIDNYAFRGCTGLTSVTIGNSVTSIGYYAFYGCTGLTSVTIPNSVTSIGENVFQFCTGLTSVAFNAENCTSAGSFDYKVFSGCDNITSFTFGDNVTIIPAYLCYGLSGLTSVTIPNSVTSIGDYAFEGCTGLTSVAFNAENCTSAGSSIDNRAFSGCDNITSFTFGDNVKNIPEYLCYGLSGLTSVTIPNSVTYIGDYAFAQCTGLSEIHSRANVAPTLGTNVFSGVTSTIPVYVPCGRSAHYYSRWSLFSNIIEEEAFTFSAVSADNTMGTVQILNMPSCASPNAVLNAVPNSGYRFDHWSDGSTNNPYSFVFASNMELTAIFSANSDTSAVVLHDTVTIHDTAYINVVVHDTVTRLDTAYVNVYVYDTTTVTEYIHDTAYITLTDTVTNTVYDTVINTVFDTVTNFIHDTTLVTVTDTVLLTEYDTIYITLYDTVYIHDTVYVPQEGVEEITTTTAKIYQRDGNIVVEGAEGHDVGVFDVVGRMISVKRREENGKIVFDVRTSGVYLVKVGDAPARRVVVIR
ncbi:MAG: leucine-rich repeat domain-containing protein [bacterium]